ncbi:hypothetical protein AX17_004134 [Amanita inopinata Kibby_2008]|nr:hypothetical protein AX17_004134 [Amanita inopinata Kibby_2008]
MPLVRRLMRCSARALWLSPEPKTSLLLRTTITLFLIKSSSATELARVGSPSPSGGDYPVSVGFNSAGTVLCALNTGKINNISCFNVNISTGLTPLAGTTRSIGLNQTTPPSGPNFTGSTVIFSPDDSKLFAVIKGASVVTGGTTDVPGFLAEWTVNADGSLSSTFTSISGGLLPWSLTPVTGTTNGYVAGDGIVGYDIFNLNTPSTPAAHYQPPGSQVICWSQYSPATGNYYLSDFLTATVAEVSIGSDLTTTYVNTYSCGQYAGNMDISIASIKGQPDHLYVLAANTTSVETFVLNGPGSAALVQTIDVAKAASAVGLPYSAIAVYGMATYIA